jgi:tetratricopeptide (TPR) repeat protein
MKSDWAIGDIIEGRWEIHDIKRGGMGIVYVVYDEEWKEVQAAKTFQDELFALSPTLKERFIREAVTWVSLDVHQNVARARIVDTIQDKPFLFLEYVGGGDLSSRIGPSGMDPVRAVAYAIQFCDGMIHVLSRGVKAHRDVKPENCLITQDETIKVTDFGIAKVFDDGLLEHLDELGAKGQAGGLSRMLRRILGYPAHDNSRMPNHSLRASANLRLSRTGVGMGTCAYMAPEQFYDAKHVDARADVYSFGIMFFEMIAGRVPFPGSAWEIIERQHKTQEPPPLPTDDEELRALTHACLEKDPSRRLQDFGAVRDVLEHAYERFTGRPAPSAVGGTELNANDLNNKGANLSRLGRSVEAIECFERAVAINPCLAVSWCNKGTALGELGRVDEELECYDRAIEINPQYAMAWEWKGAVLSELGRRAEAVVALDRAIAINPHNPDSWNHRGASLVELGRVDEALACYERAIEIDSRHAMAWHNKGNVLFGQGHTDDSIGCYERAVAIDPNLVAAWYNLANPLYLSGRVHEALSCYERALELNPTLGQAWHNKGHALSSLNRYDEAVACYDYAIRINPHDAGVWFNKACSLGALGRKQEEIYCYERAIEIDPHHAKAWFNKGVALDVLGRQKEEIDCYDRAIKINPNYVKAWKAKGTVFRALGMPDRARACFDRAVEIESSPRFRLSS